MGGTLIYFDGPLPEVFAEANDALFSYLQAEGYDLDESFTAQFRNRLDEYYHQREAEFIEITTSYILKTLLTESGYPNVPTVTIRQALDKLYAVSQTYWKVEADAAGTLTTLRERGYRLGLISNAGDDRDVQILVDNAKLRPYFDVILTSAACGIRKPNPRIFHMALSHWQSNGLRAAMVGDTLGADILGAHNAGLYSIWITRRADTPANHDHADTIKPNARIETLDELPDLLDQLRLQQANIG